MKNKGISLIVLVITIIVMIILAAAIIISLNNTGIIENSNKAVDETNEKTVQEIANLAWGEAYANGERSTSDLKDAVKKALENNNVDTKDYGINVTESGVDIAKGWLLTKNKKVIKGNIQLNIGDIVKYEDKAGENGSKKYSGNWIVFGVEDGKLIIMSDENITTKQFNSENTVEGGKAAYTAGVDELNEICKAYGTGEGAEYARSIVVEDIDKLTDYDKTTYKKGEIDEYGNKVTYYLDTTEANKNKPYYTSSNMLEGNLTRLHDSFTWYDGTSWHTQNISSDLPTSRQKIATIQSTYYSYDAKSVLGDNNIYWLAGGAVRTSTDTIRYGIRYVNDGFVTTSWMVRNDTVDYTGGVRAIVVFKSDTSFYMTEDGLNISK